MSMTRRDAAAAVGAALATAVVFRSGSAKAGCPNIETALRDLGAAKQELQTAKHDFKGHRVDALKAVDEAIKQLGACISTAPQCP
jgi:hypothetical protein